MPDLYVDHLARGKALAVQVLHSARINGHDPYAYFKPVLARLPTCPASKIDELLPHRWPPTAWAQLFG
ncbi:transposase domain-containing protein [Roseateles sp. DC23W]|uniref:Transposase domain-containing protein n=1 Tax=Pelomonas dachongensis TaxID=3299029 RepID=A0ABW7EP39_9BURK